MMKPIRFKNGFIRGGSISYELLPPKLISRSPMKNDGWKMIFLSKWSLFRRHLTFQGVTMLPGSCWWFWLNSRLWMSSTGNHSKSLKEETWKNKMCGTKNMTLDFLKVFVFMNTIIHSHTKNTKETDHLPFVRIFISFVSGSRLFSPWWFVSPSCVISVQRWKHGSWPKRLHPTHLLALVGWKVRWMCGVQGPRSGCEDNPPRNSSHVFLSREIL